MDKLDARTRKQAKKMFRELTKISLANLAYMELANGFPELEKIAGEINTVDTKEMAEAAEKLYDIFDF